MTTLKAKVEKKMMEMHERRQEEYELDWTDFLWKNRPTAHKMFCWSENMDKEAYAKWWNENTPSAERKPIKLRFLLRNRCQHD